MTRSEIFLRTLAPGLKNKIYVKVEFTHLNNYLCVPRIAYFKQDKTKPGSLR